MPFGQLVFGPPGSGKTTYCNGMQQFLTAMGRKTVVVNLDPANDALPYECAIDVRELVEISKVMEEFDLGPNGGLLYCIEYIEKNLDWLHDKLNAYDQKTYFLFDCPGQVELYTTHSSVPNIAATLLRWGFRLTGVHLVDSYYCSVPSTYVAALVNSLATMLHLELPHINVLSKIDLLEAYGPLAFDIEFFTDVGNLRYLYKRLKAEPFGKRFAKLGKALCEVVEEFSLVSFATLNIQDKESVYALVKQIDKSNGYIYGGLTQGNQSILQVAVGASFSHDTVGEIRERYMKETWEVGDTERAQRAHDKEEEEEEDGQRNNRTDDSMES